MTDRRILFNIRAHDRIAGKYERRHTQIFNPIEQERIGKHLSLAASAIIGSADRPRALDFGCGSGNMTGHLLEMGFSVTAADVSPAFLRLVAERHGGSVALETLRLNGTDLAGVPDGTFDLAVSYAVLHHIPDYLRIVRELIRVTRPGGILLIDREAAPGFWKQPELFREFSAAAAAGPRKLPWSRFLKWETYANRWRIRKDPRYQPEGDIHIWEDDHIEWDRIREIFLAAGCDVVLEEEYLSFDGKYRPEVYERYRDRCADDMMIIVRKA